jgi:hypothetical protein
MGHLERFECSAQVGFGHAHFANHRVQLRMRSESLGGFENPDHGAEDRRGLHEWTMHPCAAEQPLTVGNYRSWWANFRRICRKTLRFPGATLRLARVRRYFGLSVSTANCSREIQ